MDRKQYRLLRVQAQANFESLRWLDTDRDRAIYLVFGSWAMYRAQRSYLHRDTGDVLIRYPFKDRLQRHKALRKEQRRRAEYQAMTAKAKQEFNNRQCMVAEFQDHLRHGPRVERIHTRYIF